MIFLIIAAGAFLRLWGIFQPSLHLWDEQFHALVAKNIALHSWIPTFYYSPLLEYTPSNWQGNHVWLHKPPLGLWLGGLSMKIFGISEWAYRIPSLLFGTLSIFLTYRIAKMWFGERVAIISALLHALSGYLLIFNSGTYGMDNVDNALFFFVELSIFLWMKALEENRRGYICFSGLAMGCALLSKSYPALLSWGLFVSLAAYSKYRTKEHLLNSLLLLAVALALFLPWQIYASHRWPLEFMAAERVNLGHFFESQLLGREKDWFYHFNNIPRDYGECALFSIPFFFYLFSKNRLKEFWILSLWFIVPYLLFSLARTKIATLVYYCAPPVFISMGVAASSLWDRTQEAEKRFRKTACVVLVIGGLLTLRVTGEKMIQIGTGLFAIQKKSVINLTSKMDHPKSALFNSPYYVPVMFYSDIIAYPFLPDETQISRILSQGYSIYVQENDDGNMDAWKKTIPSAVMKNLLWVRPGPEEPEDSLFLKIRRLQLKKLIE